MIWETFFQPFYDYGFMRRALFGCIVISIGATPVGIFLLLRRMSLTGDAMAHAILPGAAIGFLISGLSLGAMTIGGLIAGLTVAILSGFVSRVTALREDASLAEAGEAARLGARSVGAHQPARARAREAGRPTRDIGGGRRV